MCNTDGNLAALAVYEREQEQAEMAYERFVEAVEAQKLPESFQDLRDEFEALKDTYDMEDEDFVAVMEMYI